MTITATDDDGDIPTFSITGGADQTLFSVTSAGALTFNRAPDFETFADADSDGVYEVEVTADDGNGGTTAQTVTINVTNVNDNNPLINDTTATVAEDAQNNGSVTNIDDANTGNDTDMDGYTLTYAITAGNNDGIFGINSATGEITVTDNTNLDYETTNQYVLTVQASDGTNTDTAAFTVDITDVNEFAVGPVTDVDTTDNDIAADASLGSPVGIRAAAEDGDGSDRVTYALVNETGPFAIDPETGIITIHAPLSEDQYTLTVQALSTDGSTSQATFTVTVNDIPQETEAPIDDGQVVMNEDPSSAPPETPATPTAETPVAPVAVIQEIPDPPHPASAPSRPAASPEHPVPIAGQITVVPASTMEKQGDTAQHPAVPAQTAVAPAAARSAGRIASSDPGIREMYLGDNNSRIGVRIRQRSLQDNWMETIDIREPFAVHNLVLPLDTPQDNQPYQTTLQMAPLWDSLDTLQAEVDQAFQETSRQQAFIIHLAQGSATTISVGVVAYLLRGGSLLSSFLSTVPLWKTFDPIAILAYPQIKKGGKCNDPDQDTPAPSSRAEEFFDNRREA